MPEFGELRLCGHISDHAKHANLPFFHIHCYKLWKPVSKATSFTSLETFMAVFFKKQLKGCYLFVCLWHHVLDNAMVLKSQQQFVITLYLASIRPHVALCVHLWAPVQEGAPQTRAGSAAEHDV